MGDLQYLIERHSWKKVRKLQQICAPLKDCLGIPIFNYFRIEEDGAFGSITNDPEHLDFYYKSQQYLINPYLSHPLLFRTGIALAPISFHPDYLEKMQGSFGISHYLMLLFQKGDHVEAFLYAIPNGDLFTLYSQIDLLEKFGAYFKREAKDLISEMMGDRFNLKNECGEGFYKSDESLPLSNKNPQIKKFLKRTYPLSSQEIRCLELYKQGNSAQASAAILGLSRRTVESYFESIKDKLNCSSKAELLEI